MMRKVQSHLGLFQLFSQLTENYATLATPLEAAREKTSADHRPAYTLRTSDQQGENANQLSHGRVIVLSPTPNRQRKINDPLKWLAKFRETRTHSYVISRCPLEKITDVRIVPNHQAHHSTPHHSEAQKHALLDERKEMPWTPQRTLVNLAPISDILPKFFDGTTSVNLGPISGVLLVSVAEITEVRIALDHQAHSQKIMHH